MIIQLCLAFTLLIWLTIAPSLNKRAQARARELYTEVILEAHKSLLERGNTLLYKEEIERLPELILLPEFKEDRFGMWQDWRIWLGMSQALAIVTSLALLLSYKFARYGVILVLASALLTWTMPSKWVTPAHPLLDPMNSAILEHASWQQAKQAWDDALRTYYHSRIPENWSEQDKQLALKGLFAYDLLSSKNPLPQGFVFPRPIGLTLLILWSLLWCYVAWFKSENSPVEAAAPARIQN